jgi:predicted Rossmann fold flavoprotein
MKQRLKIVVIGGGAAGIFGAIICAKINPNYEIIILEGGSKPLTKVKISGGGRCNVTHHCFESSELINFYPRGAKALRGAFTRFQPRDMISWLQQRGVQLKTEEDGRMFPITDNSQTIIDCFLNEVKNCNIKLKIKTVVTNITKTENGFKIDLKNGEVIECDRLLMTTGSNPSGYHFAEKLGHKIEKPVPSLFTFNISDSRLKDLQGIAVENAQLKLLNTGKQKLVQTGPVLITHWGLSGPAVLKLSAWGARILHQYNYQMDLQINWLYSSYNTESLTFYLLEIKSKNSRQKIESVSPLPIPKRLWQNLVKFSNIPEGKIWAEISKPQLTKLVLELTQGNYKIKGKGVFKDEFVTCGGVNLQEVNFQTMESKKCAGLYFAGEILDIDGITGGFNFQSAWTTGFIAGNNI